MALNRIDIGTKCTVLATGETGVVKQIYFYPTKYELEFSNGRIEHIGSKDLSIEGVTQDVPKLKIPESLWLNSLFNPEIISETNVNDLFC